MAGVGFSKITGSIWKSSTLFLYGIKAGKKKICLVAKLNSFPFQIHPFIHSLIKMHALDPLDSAYMDKKFLKMSRQACWHEKCFKLLNSHRLCKMHAPVPLESAYWCWKWAGVESLPAALSLIGEFPHDFESSASFSQHSYVEQGKHL